MATFRAIGAVGLTLQALLRDQLNNPNGGGAAVPVTLGPPGPDRDPNGTAESARVNLFLYQVGENCFLKNQDLPGAGHPGSYGQPPLSLILHYLLTVFGATANGEYFDETPAHQLLGSAMRILHDNGIITEKLVTRRMPTGVPVLDPTLRSEHENLKLTLRPLGLEELSNVWTSLDFSYRLSVAYEVSVAQIESARRRRHPRPVLEPPRSGPRVYTVALRRPTITALAVRRSSEPADVEHPVAFARVGDTLIVRGSNLAAVDLRIRLGGITTRVAPAMLSARGDRLETIVPDDALPDGTTIPIEERLQPGAHAVEVAVGVEELPNAAVASGRAAFMLVPRVDTATVAGRILIVTGSRLLAGDAPAQLIVGDLAFDRREYLDGSTPSEIRVQLASAYPTSPAAVLVSGPLDPFPNIPDSLDFSVTIGAEGPLVATLVRKPTTIVEAATLLHAAIRAASPTPVFAQSHALATSRELLIIPGDLSSPVVIAGGQLADALRLSDGAERGLFLSGALRPFPTLSSAAPQVDLTIEAATRRVSLATLPTSLANAAALLEQAIRAADPAPAFADARVTLFDDQLCLLPGAAGSIRFAAVAGSDETTASELQLSADFLVRARVNGAESIDDTTVRLPA